MSGDYSFTLTLCAMGDAMTDVEVMLENRSIVTVSSFLQLSLPMDLPGSDKYLRLVGLGV